MAYSSIIKSLELAYGRSVEEREGNRVQEWKKALRVDFLAMLKAEGRLRPLEPDHYRPKRFFSTLTDKQFQEAGGEFFELVRFQAVEVGRHWGQHFQSSVWRRRSGP